MPKCLDCDTGHLDEQGDCNNLQCLSHSNPLQASVRPPNAKTIKPGPEVKPQYVS